jgi:ribonuclease-3
MSELPKFKNPSLLDQALTHRSYVNEHPEVGEDNERLEFLGDAVLGFLIGDFLYKNYPDMSEAQLTRMRSALVEEKQLATLARELKLGSKMRLGQGAIKDGARDNPSLLCDTFEAIIGAYYLDSNITSVRAYIRRLFTPVVQSIVLPQVDENPKHLIDPKNRFQQWALDKSGKNPEYVIVKESGPDHAKEFKAEVRVNGKVFGSGIGRRKQDAEKNAAENALKKLKIDG